MINIKIMFMGYLGDFVGSNEIILELPEKSLLKELMKQVRDKYAHKIPKPLYVDGEFKMIHLMLNMQDIYEQKDGDRILADGDCLYLIPPIAGG